MRGVPENVSFGLPKPGRTVLAVLLTLLGVWVALACAVNWGDAAWAPRLLVGDRDRVLAGEVWRFATSLLVHTLSGPGAPGHLLWSLLGLYFFAPSLEARWGGRRTLGFLVGAGVFANVVQFLVSLVLPSLGAYEWYGALGVVEAVAIAWALANRNQTIRLFFVLPVSGTMLIGFIFVASVLNVIARSAPAEGLFAPFGGMLAGWLFGDASPLRRTVLRARARQLDAQTAAIRRASQKRTGAPVLRIIEGGDKPPKDRRFLN